MEEMQRPELNRWIEQAGHPPGWSCSRDPRHSDGSLPLPTGSLRTRPAIRGSDLTAIWADILGYLLTPRMIAKRKYPSIWVDIVCRSLRLDV